MWMPATQFGGGERVGMTPRGGNLISLNTLLSRTACTIPPHQNQNVAPLAVAIETSPKEVPFGCKMRIYCFKDSDMQIFRLMLIFLIIQCFQHVCLETNGLVRNLLSLQYLHVWEIFLSGMRKYALVTVHHIPWSLRLTHILACVSPGASWVTDVCYPTPTELHQCDSHCLGGGATSRRLARLCVCLRGHWAIVGQYCVCAGPKKLYLAFLSRGAARTNTWFMKTDKRL